MFVLDCSVAMAWVFEDENSAHAQRIYARLRNESALVPFLWRREAANGLLVGERRKRVPPGRTEEFLEMFENLPIETDPDESWRTVRESLRLAREHGLTVYDSTYLELAIRRSLPIASLDRALVAAAKKAGVPRL